MRWRNPVHRFLKAFRASPPLIRRQAELAFLVSVLLAGIFLANLSLKLLSAGPSWPMALRSLAMAGLLAGGWVLLARGRLEAQVNLLALLCFIQCAAFFRDEVSRQFFTLCLFSMVAFALLAVRPYQRIIAFLLFPGLVLAKGLWEFYQQTQGIPTRETGPQTVFTLLVFGASIPVVRFLLQVVGREVRHNEVLVGVTKALRKEAGTDQLTGTWNRRHFELLARKLTDEALRTGRTLALGILDLDRFKQVNDQWGHLAGDEALATLVRTVQGVLRQGDALVRWGGDEFVILCPGVGPGDTHALGEKILAAVRSSGPLAGWHLGVSMGLATWQAGEPVEDLLARADRLLYQAKEGGRGRVCYEDGPDSSACRDAEP